MKFRLLRSQPPRETPLRVLSQMAGTCSVTSVFNPANPYRPQMTLI